MLVLRLIKFGKMGSFATEFPYIRIFQNFIKKNMKILFPNQAATTRDFCVYVPYYVYECSCKSNCFYSHSQVSRQNVEKFLIYAFRNIFHINATTNNKPIS
ncbi:hypothetical protein L6164_020745 [Bauhinia variegata]|uniref:Uncharacterized protein n=1 Tax=Bauhinia variegata TaxID=167791 RepID=A0ACB9MWE8_BAUVA|nr:hypothetical protein L6164_020745 [Bauhinia variegata]